MKEQLAAIAVLLAVITVAACSVTSKVSDKIDRVAAATFCPEGETVKSRTSGPLAYEIECSGGDIISVPHRGVE